MDISAAQPALMKPQSALDIFERAVVTIAINDSVLKTGPGFHFALGRFGQRIFGETNWRKRQGFANEQYERLRCYICLLREGDAIASELLRMQLMEHGYSNGKLLTIQHWALHSG